MLACVTTIASSLRPLTRTESQAEDLTDALAAFVQLLMRPGRGHTFATMAAHDLSITQVRILHLLLWKETRPGPGRDRRGDRPVGGRRRARHRHAGAGRAWSTVGPIPTTGGSSGWR